MLVEILPFNWKNFNYAPPKYCKVERANDQFLVLKRTRNDFVERLVLAKVGGNDFVLMRFAVSLGDNGDLLSDDHIVMRGPLAVILAACGYNCRIDRLTH